jgi:hypothetical protein
MDDRRVGNSSFERGDGVAARSAAPSVASLPNSAAAANVAVRLRTRSVLVIAASAGGIGPPVNPAFRMLAGSFDSYHVGGSGARPLFAWVARQPI